MGVNRIDILNHRFSKGLRGYSTDEVDGFLHEVADALGRMSDDRVRLQNRIEQLESRLAEFVQREAALRDTLLASQKMTEELKLQAQREAQLIMDAAQAKAEGVSAQAEARLARLMEEISEAKKLKAQFEFQVRSVIEGHLKLLELGRLEEDRLQEARAALSGKTAGGK